MSLWLAIFSVLILGWGCNSSLHQPELPQLMESPEFVLQNCTGESISTQDLSGKVWLVNFIFTRCTGPCPLMTHRMHSVQEALKAEGLFGVDQPVRLVSISVDPGYDSPQVLKEYASKWNADLDGWYFLTGPEEEVMNIIRDGFKVTAQREGSGTDMSSHGNNIVHTTNFMLVGQDGWIRRIYHLGDADFQDAIARDIETLMP